jgi:mono/diheme cytochrome c family protein
MALLLAGVAGFFLTLPGHALLNLLRAPVLNAMTAAAAAAGLVILAALAAGFLAGARWLNPAYALVLVLAAAAAVTSAEFLREGTRKPYRIDRQVYGPGVRVDDADAIRSRGLVAASPWLGAGWSASASWLDRAIAPAGAEAPGAEAGTMRLGKAIFRYHCASCHAHVGYNGIVPIVRPWTPDMLRETIRNLHRANPAMPPWMGSEAERAALTAYLAQFMEGPK